MNFSGRSPLLAGCLALFATGTGCSSSEDSASAPASLSCGTTKVATDANGVRGALGGAATGTCVVMNGASFVGPFSVPAGVALTAPSGKRVSITGGTTTEPAVTLANGAELVNADVSGAPGVGVAVRGASATIESVHVTGAKTAALGVLCSDGCDSGMIVLTDVTLEKSKLGLWVHGARVTMNGGHSSLHDGTIGVASGLGIVVEGGAQLTLDGVTVEKNQGTGILIDGEKTTATVKRSTVSENAERGVWVQHVAGSIDAPAVRIENSNFVRNKIVGLGGLEARGIIVVGGRIADTVASPMSPNNIATQVEVGDGVGLFGNSTDWKIDGSIIESNARAAGVIDGSDHGIIVVGGTVAAGPSGLKFVVQKTTADVQISATDTSVTATPLYVSAPVIGLPPVF